MDNDMEYQELFAPDPAPVGPGRPRNNSHDAKLIAAVRELIRKGAPVTVTAVVNKSGVSRAALYRRWPSITLLVAAALDEGRTNRRYAITGTVKSAYEEMMFRRFTQSLGPDYTLRRFLKRIELLAGDPDLQKAYWDSRVLPRRGPQVEALSQAVTTGELRPDTDVEATVDAINGIFYYQYVVRGVDPADPDVLERCRSAFEIIWRGIANPAFKPDKKPRDESKARDQKHQFLQNTPLQS